MKQRIEGRDSMLAKATIVTALLFILLLASSLLKAQRLLIDDFDVGVKSGTTTPYIVSLTVTQTLDPGGHGPFVTIGYNCDAALFMHGPPFPNMHQGYEGYWASYLTGETMKMMDDTFKDASGTTYDAGAATSGIDFSTNS